MMILFKKLRYKNIFSFGKEWVEWDLNTHATTLFLGENGSGKSSGISDTLSFVLYGRAHRNITKGTIPNSINGKKCVVECEFSIGSKEYKIVRGIKPNVFEVWVDGKELKIGTTTDHLQDYLETEILHMNFKSFTQIVVLGKASYTPFMRLTTPDRRVFIENVLDIQIFTAMKKILGNRVTILDTEMSSVRHSLDLVDVKIAASQRMLAELARSNDARIAELTVEIGKNMDERESNAKQVAVLQEQIAALTDTIKDQEKVSGKAQKLRDFQTQISHNSVAITSTLRFFEKNDNCPTCTQVIDQGMKAKKISEGQAKIAEYDEGLKALTIQINETSVRLQEIRNTLNKISDVNSRLNGVNGNIRLYESHISRAQSEISRLQQPTGAKGDEASVLEASQNSKSKLLDDKSGQLTKKQYYDVAQTLLKDTGIRTRVIKKYLPVMNTLLNKYLKDMEFFVKFEIDENFDETIKSRYRDEFKYNNFSEGQKLRIDLALLFTFREIAKMRNGMDTNLLVFDETLDSSLDDQGVDDFLKIITEQTKLNIFVISHRSRTLKDMFSRTFEFALKNEFSVVKELE